MCRKTLLSRYNRDPLCGLCTRAAQMAPPPEVLGLPSWLWDSVPWREALARVDLPAALAVFRAAAGLSQRQLAELAGWSQSTVSLFEGGRRDTLWDIRVWLQFADAVDMPRVALLPLVLGEEAPVPSAATRPAHGAAQPVTAAEPGRGRMPGAGTEGPDLHLRAAGSSPATRAGPAGIEVGARTLADTGILADTGVLAGADPEETGVDVDRRGFGGIAAGAAAAVMLPELPVPARVTSAQIRYLQSCVDGLYSRDLSVGGGALLGQALRQWHRAQRMLGESSYSDAIGGRLLAAATDLAVCAGWLAGEAAKPPLARRILSEAHLLASNARDPVRIVNVLVQWSGLSSFVARTNETAGPAREALRLANQAAEEARHIPSPWLHAQIACRLANASSLLRDKAAFRAAITRARWEFDRGPHGDDPELARRISEREITTVEAMGHTNLGELARGEQLYRSVLDGDMPPVARAYVGSLLANSLLKQGAANDAVGTGADVLHLLAGGVASGRSLNQLRPVRAAAEKEGEEEFCARFDAADQALAAV